MRLVLRSSDPSFASGSAGSAVLDPPELDEALPPPTRLDGGGFPPVFDGRDGFGGGGSGGDGWWGEGDADDDSPERREQETSAFGLGLILAGVTTLFVIFLTAFLVMRGNSTDWPPAGSPGRPLGIWGSSFILLVSSLTVARAVRATRRKDREGATRLLAMTLALGVLFLAVQAALWNQYSRAGFLPSTNGYGSIFYALTWLHAVHILGGLVYLAVALGRQRRGAGESVPLCATYWHFMGGLWVVLVATLWS